MPSLVDSRLLNNLLKTEKDAQKSFRTWTMDMESASSALTAWATADSGDTMDIMEVSQRITQLLAACSDSQRSYLASLSAYRTSLKDVLEREANLRIVVRDREILVGRLIKLGNKKPGDSAFESHANKLDEAQRELAACEGFLQNEESALSGVKRRIFREALSMRMRSMGELGKVMEQSANEATELLSQLGSDYQQLRIEAYQNGDSTQPFRSTSPGRRTPSLASSSFSDLDRPNSQSNYVPPPLRNGRSTPEHSLSPPMTASPPPLPTTQSAPTTSIPELTARPRESPRRQTVRSVSMHEIPSSSLVYPTEPMPAIRAPRRPILPPVPVAPRGLTSYPVLEVPKAPRGVGSRKPDADSSDEEHEREYKFSQVESGRRVGGSVSSSTGEVEKRTIPFQHILRRRSNSDTSSLDNGGRSPKRRGSFFGGIASLFKRKSRDGSPQRSSAGSSSSSQWDTRTDRNVYTVQRSGLTGAGRHSTILEEDSSDEDSKPRNLIRVVNDPKTRGKAMSDSGAVTYSANGGFVLSNGSTARVTSGGGGRLEKRRSTSALSDFGVLGSGSPRIMTDGRAYASTSFLPIPVSHQPEVVKKKKKKRAESMTGISTLTSAPINRPLTLSVVEPISQRLSRSNTTQSGMSFVTIATATDGGTTTTKRKKRKSVASVPLIPTTPADLAASLPSAQSSRSIALARAEVSNSIPAHLAATELQMQKDAARFGTGSWIPKPGHHVTTSSSSFTSASSPRISSSLSSPAISYHATSTTHHPPSTLPVSSTGTKEKRDSLMTIVDRDEKQSRTLEVTASVALPSVPEEITSRRYGNNATSQLSLPGSTSPVPTVIPHPSENLLSPNAAYVGRRKSVRLADGSTEMNETPARSPAPSVRSDHPSPIPLPHGILLNHQSPHISPPGSFQGNGNGHERASSVASDTGSNSNYNANPHLSTTWAVRGAQEDSSDEDEEYTRARKAFAKGTKGLAGAGLPPLSKKDKGKGRAVDY